MKKKVKKEKKVKKTFHAFYPVRHYRISEENHNWLLKIKKGTWNNTFNKIKKIYGNETV